jgi:SHS2 domain-containing protein
MGTYHTIDHTADIAIEISGNSLEDLFRTAYQAWYEIVLDYLRVLSQGRKRIKLKADSPEELLVNFINEINYWLMVKKWITAKIEKLELSDTDGHLSLRVVAAGRPLDIKRHELQLEVKAVTFYQLEIKQTGHNFFTRMVFDV